MRRRGSAPLLMRFQTRSASNGCAPMAASSAGKSMSRFLDGLLVRCRRRRGRRPDAALSAKRPRARGRWRGRSSGERAVGAERRGGVRLREPAEIDRGHRVEVASSVSLAFIASEAWTPWYSLPDREHRRLVARRRGGRSRPMRASTNPMRSVATAGSRASARRTAAVRMTRRSLRSASVQPPFFFAGGEVVRAIWEGRVRRRGRRGRPALAALPSPPLRLSLTRAAR